VPQQALPFSAPSRPAGPTVFARLAPAKPTIVFDTYWRFAAERQAIFFRRVTGTQAPWTSDPILARHKFTNAYRASDRVSQYLIKQVIYSGEQTPEELFFRVILFKLFNKIETWELLQQAFDGVAYREYSSERYDRVLSSAQARGQSIYSGAYIMPTGGKAFPPGPKHRMHLMLLDRMMKDDLPARVFAATRLSAVFDMLRSYPTIGDFLAYQYATDLNYTRLMPDLEADFVVPGPGARDGIRKCFSDLGGRSSSGSLRTGRTRSSRAWASFFRTSGGVDCNSSTARTCSVRRTSMLGSNIPSSVAAPVEHESSSVSNRTALSLDRGTHRSGD
jgi:hypothetical protein